MLLLLFIFKFNDKFVENILIIINIIIKLIINKWIFIYYKIELF